MCATLIDNYRKQCDQGVVFDLIYLELSFGISFVSAGYPVSMCSYLPSMRIGLVPPACVVAAVNSVMFRLPCLGNLIHAAHL